MQAQKEQDNLNHTLSSVRREAEDLAKRAQEEAQAAADNLAEADAKLRAVQQDLEDKTREAERLEVGPVSTLPKPP